MKRIIFAGLAALFLAPLASAHTVALGTMNAGSPGSVTLWLGSYHNPGENTPNEGSMTLDGVTTAFNLASSTLPTGLTAGTNYFYSDCANSPGCGTPDFNDPTNNTTTTVIRWQGVTFTGLSAGTYTYNITGMNTAVWNNWGNFQANWTGTVVITGQTVGVVPEPGTLALLGLGLVGVGFARRRRA